VMIKLMLDEMKREKRKKKERRGLILVETNQCVLRRFPISVLRDTEKKPTPITITKLRIAYSSLVHEPNSKCRYFF